MCYRVEDQGNRCQYSRVGGSWRRSETFNHDAKPAEQDGGRKEGIAGTHLYSRVGGSWKRSGTVTVITIIPNLRNKMAEFSNTESLKTIIYPKVGDRAGGKIRV
jgi:hypothetical protein